MKCLQAEREDGAWADDERLSARLLDFRAEPLDFVMFAYPWNTNTQLQVVELPLPWRERYDANWGPDKWACEFLDQLGEEVRARNFRPGITGAVLPIRMARVSGHGIGKSALVGWLVDWIMSTRQDSQGTVTANTAKQLETKTWKQILFWTRLAIFQQRPLDRRWFTLTSGRGTMSMRYADADSHPNWFCTGQTCDIENSEAFAGQHAATATSFYIFDEASGIDDKIDEVSEGGLTDGEPMKFAFGNGTQTGGWFYVIHKTEAGRKRWLTGSVDSRQVQITNKVLLNQQVEDHGENSDWVKVRIRGMFPQMSALQFLNGEDIEAAYGRELKPASYSFAPKVLTLDNAWWGDDEGVIGLRQGLAFWILKVFAKNDNDIEVAGLLRNYEDEYQADGVFIDFGYGTGVASCGKTWGRDWKLVNFGAKSPEAGFLNLRAWIYNKAKLWMKAGGAMPRDQRLYDDCYNVHTVPRIDGTIQIESKKDLRARGMPSPGRLDALVISFAYPVIHKVTGLDADLKRAHAKKRGEYNPLDYYRGEK